MDCPTKVCNQCQREFPMHPAFFMRQASTKCGFRGKCKLCIAPLRAQKVNLTEELLWARMKETEGVIVCTSCLEPKAATAENFGSEKRTKSGYCSECRDCDREYHRERRRLNPDADREYYEKNKDWLLPKMSQYAKNRRKESPNEVRAVEAAYREKNRDKINEYQRKRYPKVAKEVQRRLREYYDKNPNKRRERNAAIEEWRRKNREKARSYVRNRRAKINRSPGTHTDEDVAKQLAGQKSKCWWCRCKIKGRNYHVDHRIPIGRGGGNGPDNIVIACARCNQTKNVKMPWEMDKPFLL